MQGLGTLGVLVATLTRVSLLAGVPKAAGVGEREGDGEAMVSEEEQDAEADRLVEETAKMLQNAVREAKVQVIAQVMTAIGKNSPGALAKILSWRDRVGATALHWCAFYGTEAHAVLAKTFLLIPGVDAGVLDNSNRTACQTACLKGHAEVLFELVTATHGNDCDPLEAWDNTSCLHHAAERGDTRTLDVMRPFLTPDNVDRRGGSLLTATPLYLAVRAGSTESVRLLKEVGASSGIGRLTADGEEDSAMFLAQQRLADHQAILAALEDEEPSAADRTRSEL